MREQYEGTRRWAGSPQDFNDVISPPKRGMDAVTNGPLVTGLYKGDDDAGTSPVRVRPRGGNGNGNGHNGGAAKVPTPVGGSW
jgi:hypothetical protein